MQPATHAEPRSREGPKPCLGEQGCLSTMKEGSLIQRAIVLALVAVFAISALAPILG
jgi:hypothetical protein